jgi:alkylation response protein AidB-like acyl-CoA dehydrogenase
MNYQAPVEDMLFLMTELADLDKVAALPGFEDATPDTVAAVLEEAARFSGNVLAPLNATGDREPAVWRDGAVTTSPGFADAYRQFTAAGWQGLQHPETYGGQGLPKLVAAACNEMLNAANLSFALCPLLSDGAIEALLTAGSEAQRALYLPRLISGEWAGTMNLTEPQAGSDLAQVRTRAVPQDDGRYRVFGTKIFITYGEHDLTDNIVHLVLARLPDAPPGVKGISLFVVPKFLVDETGAIGERNDVHCVSIEHKLGIHGSPTAVLQFGDAGGAIGEMVGLPNRGLEYMFIMMNAARFGVGLQGIGIADRAYQAARAYAKERVQGKAVSASAARPVTARPIISHPDVRRMLMTMRGLTEGARAVAYRAASANDLAHHSTDTAERAHYAALNEYLVPVIKGWSTEMSVEVASLAVQVHGGMGFIEETGVAQYYRDARILPIYEGTTAIQANDLVGRKTVRDQGAVAKALAGEIEATAEALCEAARASEVDGEAASFTSIATQLQTAGEAFAEAVDFIVANVEGDPVAVYAGSVPYLKLTGIVLSGWQLGSSALAARAASKRPGAASGAVRFAQDKLATARFFAEHILPQALALKTAIVSARGDEGMLEWDDDRF